MSITPEAARKLAQELHSEEEKLKEIAEDLPEGDSREQVFMSGERLSDKAWAIEEAEEDGKQP